MAQLGKYILSVTAAAIIVGILTSILDKKSGSAALVKMIAGLFLAFTAIAPIAKLDFSNLTAFAQAFEAQGTAAAADGEIMAQEAMADIIKSETEAYILDKAETYGAALEVEVTLRQTDGIPVPTGVRLAGRISPYAKAQLQQMMEAELGISKENQLWIG